MQKKTIVGMILTTAVLTPPAGADALLFPVITRSQSVSTFISVVNKTPAPGAGQLFVNYFNKVAQSGTADFQTQCNNEGRRQIVNNGRQNDIVSWDASGNFQTSTNGGPLFNDPAVVAPYGNADFKMGGGTAPGRGFLIVDNGDNNTIPAPPPPQETTQFLYGEAFLMDIVSGAAWGYRAYNANDNTATPNPDFGTQGGGNLELGEVLDVGTNTGNAAITVLPPSEWTTRFFVTPVSDGTFVPNPNLQRDCETCSARIYISSDKAGTKAGLFDRDTTDQSITFVGPVPLSAQNIVCSAGPTLIDLMPLAQFNAIMNQGGWGYAQVRQGSSGITTAAAVVIKLEFNLTSSGTTTRISPDTTKTFSGIVNTAVWLRNDDNVTGTSGF